MTDPNNLDFTVPDPWGDLPGYALNALTAEERARVEDLLEQSHEAQEELRRLMETTESLSALVSSAEPSASVRRKILARADSDIHLMELALQEAESVEPAGRSSFLSMFSQPARMAYAGTAAAIISVIGIAAIFGIENARLNGEVDDLRTEMRTELAQVSDLREAVDLANSNFAVQDAEVARLTAVNVGLNEALKDLQWLTYVTQNKEYRVPEYLVGNEEAPEAIGSVAVRNFDDLAVFLVSFLPQAPEGYDYTLWLIRDGVPNMVAQFKVNQAGQARVEFALPDNISQYESAIVTLEPADSDSSSISGLQIMSATEPG